MKKIKIKQRVENAFNAFFDDEISATKALAVVDNSAIMSNHATLEFSQKADKYYAIFKKLFLFFPGVLILHLASISFAVFYNEIGINFWMLFWFSAGIFMTWAGIGDMRNKKHFLIPLSVISLGLAVGLMESFLPSDLFQFSFLLIPLFFIAPVLTKDAIDKFDENEPCLTN